MPTYEKEEKQDIYEIIRLRRSVRSYRDTPVSEDTLKKILEAARMAPSAHNSQDFKLVIVQNKDIIKQIAKAASDQRFIMEAPIVIAGVSLNPNDAMESGVPTYALDLAIVLDHITLAAVQEELGTCWVGSFNQDEVKRILNVPENCKIAALLTLGTPYDDPGVKSRKPLNDIVSYENFA